ncbi:MAG: hypothetical protein R3F20_00535 [Planctomycetota bacterium]
MQRIASALAVVLVLSALGFGQATNDANLTFTVNGVDTAAPNVVDVQRPGVAVLDVVTGNPNLPFIIAFGSNIAIADQIIGPVQVDVGPAAGILVNGVTPTTFLDFLGNTGAGASAQFSFPLGTQLPLGPLVALQAFAVDFTVPGAVVDSSATLINMIQPLNYGTVAYLRGANTGDMTSFSSQAGVGSIQYDLPGASIDIESFNTNEFTYFTGNTSLSIRAERTPTVPGPAFNYAKNTSFDHIKTVYGDLYHFDDLLSNPREFGFALVPGGGLPPIEIPGSRFTNPTTTGFSTTSPWEIECAISPDQTTLAVVYDPSSGNDQLFLIKLDGTTFASTGTAVVDVTPGFVQTTILEESITFSGGRVYFVDGTATGNLFSAPLDGSAVGSPVTFPLIGGALPVTAVDGEMFYVAVLDSIIVQAGNGTSAEDLFLVNESGGVETVINLTNFASAMDIEEFGDAYDGNDGQIAVSPDGSRVAFIVVDSTDDELYWVTTDGTGTPQLLTDVTAFDIGIDDVIDLNFWDNENIMFFAGTTTALMDLYNVNITNPGAPVYTNVTMTNGLSGATLPIAATPTSLMDPDGYFTVGGRMIFARDGTVFAGTGGTTSFGLVGVEYATLTAYNILGDEFPGAAGEVGFETANTGLLLTLSPTSDRVWFKSAVGGSSTKDEELFSFDANVSAPATNMTVAGGGGTSQVDNITPDQSGASCLFSYRPSSTGDEEVFLAIFGVPGVTQLTNDASTSTDITDSSIQWLPTSNPNLGFVYAAGTSSTANPADAVLLGYDLGTGLVTEIDTMPFAFHVLGISFP